MSLSGVWVSDEGTILQLIQTGNRVRGAFRGGRRGGAVIAGQFDGRNFVGMYQGRGRNAGLSGRMRMTLTGNDRLVGARTAPDGSNDTFVFTRRNRGY